MNLFKSKKLRVFRIVVIAITIVCFIISPVVLNSRGVFAQDNARQAIRQTAGEAGLLNDSSVVSIVGNIVFVILGLLGIIFIILIIYGGFTRMTAGGNQEAIKKSTGIITSAAIGLLIILASYAITAFVLSRIEFGTQTGDAPYEPSIPIEPGDEDSGINCYMVGGWCTPSLECHSDADSPRQRMSVGQMDCEPGEACCVYADEYY